MNNPVVLDKAKSCYECKNHGLCYAWRTLDKLVSAWHGFLGPSWLNVFVALAGSCDSFTVHTPPDPDGPRMMTLVIQVCQEDLESVKRLACGALKNSWLDAKLYTCDMKVIE